jgi:UDP:flavonoid glycosyltransferase YjiC (YdhE family)
MGTIQDCIAHGVPIVAVHEPGNIELVHNGQRLEQLRLGIYLGANPEPSAVVAAVRSLDRSPLAEEFRQRMKALPKDGYRQAADWLVARLTGVR